VTGISNDPLENLRQTNARLAKKAAAAGQLIEHADTAMYLEKVRREQRT
jgi:hypothetical protein